MKIIKLNMPLVVLSTKDPVSKTMIKLKPPFDFVTDERDTIELNDLDKKYDTDLFIIVSRHESKSKIPVFSAHFTGEINKGKVGATYPSYHKKFLNLISGMNPEYQVTTEPMHHTPVLSKPVLFVEIGSSPKEWYNVNSVEKLMHAIELLLNEKIKDYIPAIGIGGNHYPKKFNDLILNDEYAFGPIISKWYTDYLTEKIFKELVNKSVEKIQVAFIDKKTKNKAEIEKWCNELGIDPVRF